MDATPLQRRLVALGHRLAVDGIYGPGTQDAALAALAALGPAAPAVPCTTLTPRIVLEIAAHEAIVPEAYKDSVGVWTWALGVTNASGHQVHPRYKDAPQTLRHCLEVSIWLLRERYLPQVLAAFGGMPLSEAQLGAALSFHYNTGAIARAGWVQAWRTGEAAGAREAFMEWRKPAEIIPRREKERDLFFDGRWTGDGQVTVYDVAKPSYAPKRSSARRVDIAADVSAILGADA